jgi:hypothetical protein
MTHAILSDTGAKGLEARVSINGKAIAGNAKTIGNPLHIGSGINDGVSVAVAYRCLSGTCSYACIVCVAQNPC